MCHTQSWLHFSCCISCSTRLHVSTVWPANCSHAPRHGCCVLAHCCGEHLFFVEGPEQRAVVVVLGHLCKKGKCEKDASHSPCMYIVLPFCRVLLWHLCVVPYNLGVHAENVRKSGSSFIWFEGLNCVYYQLVAKFLWLIKWGQVCALCLPKLAFQLALGCASWWKVAHMFYFVVLCCHFVTLLLSGATQT